MNNKEIKILLHSAIAVINNLPNGGVGMAIGINKAILLIQQALKEFDNDKSEATSQN